MKLSAAQALFGELGYDAVSVGQIAARAGVAVGAFCQHFASKRQLVVILMDQLLTHVAALTAQTQQPTAIDARTAIDGLVRQGLQLDWAYAGAYRAWREATVHEPEPRALHLQIEAWSASQIHMLFLALHQLPGARPDVNLVLLQQIINLLF